MTRAAEGTLVPSRTPLLAQLCWEVSAPGSRNSEHCGLWAPVPPLPLALLHLIRDSLPRGASR